MNISAMFLPLKSRKGIKVFFIAVLVLSIIYFSFSVALSLLTSGPFPQTELHYLLLFGAFKAFSGFTLFDWIILALFPLLGGLLFANYNYWKCKSSKAANSGLVAGLLAATCPACILPVLGISSAVTFLTQVSIYIKIAALLIVLGATYYIANKQSSCNI